MALVPHQEFQNFSNRIASKIYAVIVGLKKKMGITICPILSKCHIIIHVLMWMQAERQGINKHTNKANTQLELGEAKISVKEVVQKLSAKIECIT